MRWILSAHHDKVRVNKEVWTVYIGAFCDIKVAFIADIPSIGVLHIYRDHIGFSRVEIGVVEIKRVGREEIVSRILHGHIGGHVKRRQIHTHNILAHIIPVIGIEYYCIYSCITAYFYGSGYGVNRNCDRWRICLPKKLCRPYNLLRGHIIKHNADIRILAHSYTIPA